MQIFYDGLGAQDRYLLDAGSGDTFMRKFKDDTMKLIETMVERSHNNKVKPLGRGVMPKGHLINSKLEETSMLLDWIKKMAEVHNLLMDRLNI